MLTDCSIVLLYGVAHQRKIEKYLKAANHLEFYSKNYSITNTVMYLAILYWSLRSSAVALGECYLTYTIGILETQNVPFHMHVQYLYH